MFIEAIHLNGIHLSFAQCIRVRRCLRDLVVIIRDQMESSIRSYPPQGFTASKNQQNANILRESSGQSYRKHLCKNSMCNSVLASECLPFEFHVFFFSRKWESISLISIQTTYYISGFSAQEKETYDVTSLLLLYIVVCRSVLT